MTCSCAADRIDQGDLYAAGPTTCVAHPAVMKNIKSLISKAKVLSAADARLATLSGMLGIPAIDRAGFNDGVIYPIDEPAPASAPPAAGPERAHAMLAPQAKATLNCLVLLVDFNDNQATTPAQHFDSLLFDATSSNSMRSFYREMSHGQLDITGVVTGWYRAKHPYSYYTNGQSGMSYGYPRNTPGLLVEALDAFTTANSLKPFDNNGDGYLDGLFLVHAGGGAEAETNENKRKDMIWSHKWVLPNVYSKHGKKAYAYFTAPEDGKIGVFSHEFGHFLGLPDLYDSTYRSAGIGNWCLMAGGSWNGKGDKPARMSAWCLDKLGWINPQNAPRSTPRRTRSFKLPTLETDKTACLRVPVGPAAPNEYFLIENRQQTGRDAKLPGHGLAVWHIDNTQSDNNNPLAYKVALIQADGKRDLEYSKNSGDPGDLFPGALSVSSLDDTSPTHPHLRTNSGASTGIALTQISEISGAINFKLKS